jgi:hypothetical protein
MWGDLRVPDSLPRPFNSGFRYKRAGATRAKSYLRRFILKAYVITTGSMFVLIFAAHVWRAAVEGPGLVKSPVFVISSLVAVALALWAWQVLKSLRKS